MTAKDSDRYVLDNILTSLKTIDVQFNGFLKVISDSNYGATLNYLADEISKKAGRSPLPKGTGMHLTCC